MNGIKDWSQPLKVLIFLAFSVLAAVYIGELNKSTDQTNSLLQQIRDKRVQTPAPLGLASNQLTFSTSSVTNTSVTCPSVTSTLVADFAPERQNFFAGNNTTNTITLCRASTCASSTAGIVLNPSSSPMFEQKDGYIGPYSCVSSNGSSTLGVTK